VATKYGVLSAGGFASRWTCYIDKSGKVAYIEKTVNPATSAEDLLARLAQLNVSTSREGSVASELYQVRFLPGSPSRLPYQSTTCGRSQAPWQAGIEPAYPWNPVYVTR